jgi:hypothetical protein
MHWLTHNAIADMPGPSYLLVYGILVVITLGIVRITTRRLDPSLELDPPTVPGKLSRRIVAVLARYAPEDLISASTTGQRAADLIRRPTVVVWIRLWKGGPSRVFRFSTPQSRPIPSESATRLM